MTDKILLVQSAKQNAGLEVGFASSAIAPWPTLAELGLQNADRARRRDCIGGSDANVIFGGDAKRLIQLWREKRGEHAPEDLTQKIAVMLGNWTEAFNRQWYERTTGHVVSKVGYQAAMDDVPWRRCTLDGYVESLAAVWEAKHTSAFASSEEVLERYMPQLQHNMAVTRTDRAILSVIFGNSKFEIFDVASDWLYQLELLEAETAFWECVNSGREPVATPPPPPPRPVGTREVCLEGSNAWAAAACDWLENRDAAKMHAAASTTIKSLVEPDVCKAFGHGVEAKRSKSGAITIRDLRR